MCNTWRRDYLDELNQDAIKSFVYGALISFGTNAASMGVKFIINKKSVELNSMADVKAFFQILNDSGILIGNRTEDGVGKTIIIDESITNKSEMVDIMKSIYKDAEIFIKTADGNISYAGYSGYDVGNDSSITTGASMDQVGFQFFGGKNDNAVNSIRYNNLITGMEAHDAKHGQGSAINVLYNYLYSEGDITDLSRAGGFRQLVASLSRSELENYFINIIEIYNKTYSYRRDTSTFFHKYGNSKDGTFGGNQGGISSLCKYYINGVEYTYWEAMNICNQAIANGQPIPIISKKGTPEYFYLRQKLTSLGFSESDASIIMSTVDDVGACSYATVVNEIFASFIGREAEFEKCFGYPMFNTNPDGTKVLNTNELLLDIYVYANKTSNGGYLINDNNTLNRYAMSDSRYDVFGRQMLDAKNQIYMSTSLGKNTSVINDFLNSKGIKYTNIKNYDYYNNKGISNFDFNNMISDVKNSFNSGKLVSLDIFTDVYSGNLINMISMDPNNYYSDSTNAWIYKDETGKIVGGGHSIFITGIGTDCFYVSSWGKEFKIPFSDLQNGGKFVINISEIY